MSKLETKLLESSPPIKKPKARVATDSEDEAAAIQEVTENPHVSQEFCKRMISIHTI